MEQQPKLEGSALARVTSFRLVASSSCCVMTDKGEHNQTSPVYPTYLLCCWPLLKYLSKPTQVEQHDFNCGLEARWLCR